MESGDGLVLEHHMEFEALAILDLLSALETALALVFLTSSSYEPVPVMVGLPL